MYMSDLLVKESSLGAKKEDAYLANVGLINTWRAWTNMRRGIRYRSARSSARSLLFTFLWFPKIADRHPTRTTMVATMVNSASVPSNVPALPVEQENHMMDIDMMKENEFLTLNMLRLTKIDLNADQGDPTTQNTIYWPCLFFSKESQRQYLCEKYGLFVGHELQIMQDFLAHGTHSETEMVEDPAVAVLLGPHCPITQGSRAFYQPNTNDMRSMIHASEFLKLAPTVEGVMETVRDMGNLMKLIKTPGMKTSNEEHDFSARNWDSLIQFVKVPIPPAEKSDTAPESPPKYMLWPCLVVKDYNQLFAFLARYKSIFGEDAEKTSEIVKEILHDLWGSTSAKLDATNCGHNHPSTTNHGKDHAAILLGPDCSVTRSQRTMRLSKKSLVKPRHAMIPQFYNHLGKVSGGRETFNIFSHVFRDMTSN